MTNHLFTRIGNALFGPHFKGDLAVALGVEKREVQRWCSESVPVPVPDDIVLEVEHLLRERHDRIWWLLVEMKQQAEAGF